MKDRIKESLQSNMFILLLALFLGFLCHYFVTNEIMTSDKSVKRPMQIYSSAFFS